MFRLSSTIKRCLAILLLLLQVGFVNAEGLWMEAAKVEHHHLLEASSTAAQFQLSNQHQDAAHHCDVCHGHSVHAAIIPCLPSASVPPMAVLAEMMPANAYLSTYPNSIYRPPIASV